MITCNIERSICKCRLKPYNIDCAYLNDGRYTFYTPPTQLLEIDFENPIILQKVIKSFQGHYKNYKVYLVIHLTDSYYQTIIKEKIQRFTTSFEFLKDQNIVLVQIKKMYEMEGLIEEVLYDMIKNSVFVGFWLGNSIPCITTSTEILKFDMLINSFLITFGWDGNNIQIYDYSELLEKEFISQLFHQNGIKVVQDKHIPYVCCS